MLLLDPEVNSGFRSEGCADTSYCGDPDSPIPSGQAEIGMTVCVAGLEMTGVDRVWMAVGLVRLMVENVKLCVLTFVRGGSYC